MRWHHHCWLRQLVLGCVTLSHSVPGGSNSAPLQLVADIPMPGPAVRFDYQRLDVSQGRLYLSHMNANQLVLFDAHTRQVIANLDGFPPVGLKHLFVIQIDTRLHHP